MGKQSMGTPAQNIYHRTDNKLYRLQTGQTPIVRPSLHNEYGMDGYPNGMNAIVAVIAYTGYDMEDASIIAKSSHERGYGYGTIYKSEFVDLADKQRGTAQVRLHFGLFGTDEKTQISVKVLKSVEDFLDLDGLPKVGIKLTNGDPLYAYYDDDTGKVTIEKYKSLEDAFVDQVRLIGKFEHLFLLSNSVHFSKKITIIRERFWYPRASKNTHQIPHSTSCHYWRQVFIQTRSKRCDFSEMAFCRHALF
jgi:DNA-directed RNA polymerase I subunit RPA2